MKLYAYQGACSRAANILLREAKVPVELVMVDLQSKRTEEGHDYLSINPLGFVPSLELGDGEILTENLAILQWIGDIYGIGPIDALARARQAEELSFLSAELHKSFSPFFASEPLSGEAHASALAKLHTNIGHYERKYLTRERDLDIASAYAFVILSWANFLSISLADHPSASAFIASFTKHPAVAAAIAAETPEEEHA